MDKSSSSGASYSKDNTQPPQRPQNSSRNFRSRQQGERDLPYTDLRELLNHKRQNPDSKNGGPPLDPKYNYLSDPMRDGESSNGTITSGTNSNNYNNNNFGFGRASNRSNFRSPRGRGRSSFNNFPQEVSYQHHPKPGPSNEAGRFPREWDQGKEDPRNRRYNTFKRPQYPGPSNDTSNFQYQDARPINPNYKGPPHKYNPNYRGGSQKFSPRRYPNPDPVNISVEYNVEDGFRKCTALDVKLDKVWKKGQNKKNIQQQKHPEDEENWDDVTPNPTKVVNSETEFPNTEKGIKPDVTPEVRRSRKNYYTSRNKYIKPEYTKKQNKKTVEEQKPSEIEENWDEDLTPHETVKRDNPKTETPNINEKLKDNYEAKTKPEVTTPEVQGPTKISTDTKTHKTIETTPKNEHSKSEENIPETGSKTSKTKIQSNDGDKTTSEVHKGPIEEIPEGTKSENAEKNVPEVETGPKTSKTEIQSNGGNKIASEVHEGTIKEISEGTKSENAEKNIPEVETGPEISKTEVLSNNGDKNTSEVYEGPIEDISAGTSEIPKGTSKIPEGNSEIPEGTSEIPKGTSKVHEGPSEIIKESAKVDETLKDEKNTPNAEESPTTTEKEAK